MSSLERTRVKPSHLDAAGSPRRDRTPVAPMSLDAAADAA
jgi:hypothetical protein